jgi:hypothetical protein
MSDGSDEACDLILIRTVDGRERRDCGHFQIKNYQNRKVRTASDAVRNIRTGISKLFDLRCDVKDSAGNLT